MQGMPVTWIAVPRYRGAGIFALECGHYRIARYTTYLKRMTTPTIPCKECRLEKWVRHTAGIRPEVRP
jgi:hypothetical protein